MKIIGIMMIYIIMIFFCYGVCKEASKNSDMPDIGELNVRLACLWPITLTVYVIIIIYRCISPLGESLAKRVNNNFKDDDG